MVDITHKSNTLREAVAQAIVKVSKWETIKAIEDKTVPKGDVFEMSRAAGLLAIKKTPEILPDCHPIPIEYAGFEFSISELEIEITCKIKTIYKTGVEVEAMHGASVVALNMYDMLKPIDKGIEIHKIKLLKKSGGKSDIKISKDTISAAVVVCSDSIFNKTNEDFAGKAVIEILKNYQIETKCYEVIPDEMVDIQNKAKFCQEQGFSIIIFVGGTGYSKRDNTPDALIPLLDQTLPGIEETIRAYGQNRTPYAMFSRTVVGTIGQSVVMALPGSTKGASESIQAVFPAILHLFEVINGSNHGK